MIEPENKCKCVHSPVCFVEGKFRDLLRNMLELRFGGPRDGSAEFYEWVRKYCKHRRSE